MKILGISAFYHDAAAAIIEDGKITAAAQEERFTRKKNDASFPLEACKFCLEYAGLTTKDLDAIAFYDKPLLKFERLLETYYHYAPKGFLSFAMAMPIWLKEKIFIKRMIRQELKKLGAFPNIKLLFPEHHLSHAASAFYPSPFQEAAIVTMDGVGEWATTSICKGTGNQIEVVREIHFPHSLGLLYSAFTYWLGFKVNSGEYKLMGMAPYGIADSERVHRYTNIIKKDLVDLKEDGSFQLHQKYFTYTTGLRMVDGRKWEKLFGFPRRSPESDLEQHHCDLAFAVQKVTEEMVITIAKEAQRITESNNLCIAGGVALNCVANGKLLREKVFDNLFIQPAAGDAGGALGAALAAHHIYFMGEREVNSTHSDKMNGSYLGPEFSNLDVERMVKKNKATGMRYKGFDELSNKIASLLADGNIIGWFQGRMEFGPRALGNRSILADPRSSEMQQKLNLKIKYRESFRPFAPVVLEEDTYQYFDLQQASPYMLLVVPLKEELKEAVPVNYSYMSIMDRLYIKRSTLPAVTHVDFTARVQTISEESNPKLRAILLKFKEKTGFGVLVNTSFNVRGEPLVCTPEDAYRCFMRTEMDYLVINDYLFHKNHQPKWKEKEVSSLEFPLD